MKQDDKKTFFLVAQTAVGGVLVNVSTLALVVLTVGIGALLHSRAMEWTGAAMFWICLLSRVAPRAKARAQMFYCPQELADHLQEKYGVRAR
ncbi:hypothetical protein NKW53_11980 [Acetobacter orientalis]|uniref:hypothetical protein n=1 Tax=Acetobacter orientalis TaxID=146474 RepID=UPI00209F5ECD|nr:hypothetical protein [Acetobacter orientalis]MCP1216784.1 hypothetical protein [Acetobacter orientalis]MCP1219511.1 hypothetical protein [Acetobacter orientalis]